MDFFGLGDDDGGSSGDSGSSSGRGGSGKKPNQQNFYIILLAVLIGISIISYMMRGAATQTKEVDYNQFVSMVDKGEVARVKIESDRIDIAPKTKAADNKNAPYRYYTGKVEDDDTLTKRLLEKDVIVRGEVQDSTAMIISLIVSYVLPLVLLWGLMSLIFRRMSRGGGMMGGPIKRGFPAPVPLLRRAGTERGRPGLPQVPGCRPVDPPGRPGDPGRALRPVRLRGLVPGRPAGLCPPVQVRRAAGVRGGIRQGPGRERPALPPRGLRLHRLDACLRPAAEGAGL